MYKNNKNVFHLNCSRSFERNTAQENELKVKG